MMESKDLGIKLFGKKIHLPVEGEIQEIGGDDLSSQSMREEYDREVEEGEGEKTEEDCSSKMDTEDSPEDDDEPPPGLDDSTNSEESPESNVNPKTPSIDEENTKSKTEKSQNGTSNNSQEKTLKKPDKILPCPRCNSMDTKFCYYNNYNVNQPRHFCKACQRYWTAGGTMRNVPVGAGRRKNKNSASHYRHITISEALQAARIDTPNGMNFHHQHSHLKSNGRVLSFGLDHHAPICDSMASALNLTEKKEVNGVTRNGFHGQKTRENGGDDCSSGSTVTVSNSIDEGTRHINGFIPPVPCIPGIPWQYQWNTSIPPPPGFYPSGVPMPFYPVWNYAIPNVPWLSPAQQGSKQNPDSPKLGKHLREMDVISVEDDVEKPDATKPKNGCVLVPKTLRIDDPNEAAKSSIWKTLGIKNESINGGGLFKGFQPKSNEKSCVNETSKVLHANPAALSRSIKFHESS